LTIKALVYLGLINLFDISIKYITVLQEVAKPEYIKQIDKRINHKEKINTQRLYAKMSLRGKPSQG